VVHPNEHLVVTGPGRSGKTTALATVTAAARRAAPGLRVVVCAPGRSPLPMLLDPDVGPCAATAEAVGRVVDDLLTGAGPGLVVVDDADLLDDGGHLARLVEAGRPDVHLVAAGRADRLRILYRHWTTEARRSRTGVLLHPDEIDGDLLGARLPLRLPPTSVPGRGWLVVDGEATHCQLACPGPV